MDKISQFESDKSKAISTFAKPFSYYHLLFDKITYEDMEKYKNDRSRIDLFKKIGIDKEIIGKSHFSTISRKFDTFLQALKTVSNDVSSYTAKSNKTKEDYIMSDFILEKLSHITDEDRDWFNFVLPTAVRTVYPRSKESLDFISEITLDKCIIYYYSGDLKVLCKQSGDVSDKNRNKILKILKQADILLGGRFTIYRDDDTRKVFKGNNVMTTY